MKNWLKDRPVPQFAIAALLGFVAAFFGSANFLPYAFGITAIAAFIFAVLSGNGAEEEKPSSPGQQLMLSLLIGTGKPTAKVKDLMALRCFFLSVTVLGAMTVGLFAAVPFQ